MVHVHTCLSYHIFLNFSLQICILVKLIVSSAKTDHEVPGRNLWSVSAILLVAAALFTALTAFGSAACIV